MIQESSDESEARDHQDAEQSERSYPRGLLLWAQDGQAILEMVPNPQSAVDSYTDEHATPGPPMNVVELLVSIPWAKEKGKHRVLRSEKEDDGELSEGHETSTVRVGDQLRICGDADDHGSEVSSDQDHWNDCQHEDAPRL